MLKRPDGAEAPKFRDAAHDAPTGTQQRSARRSHRDAAHDAPTGTQCMTHPQGRSARRSHRDAAHDAPTGMQRTTHPQGCSTRCTHRDAAHDAPTGTQRTTLPQGRSARRTHRDAAHHAPTGTQRTTHPQGRSARRTHRDAGLTCFGPVRLVALVSLVVARTLQITNSPLSVTSGAESRDPPLTTARPSTRPRRRARHASLTDVCSSVRAHRQTQCRPPGGGT